MTPSGPGGPGMAPGGQHEPGMGTGGRAPGGRSGPVIPHQRGTVTGPPVSPPQATISAGVRAGSQYGRSESLDGDFGASSGYADGVNGPHGMNGPGGTGPNGAGPKAPGVYGGAPAPTEGGNTYGRAPGGAGQGYGEGYDTGNDYGSENYGPGGDGYAVEGGYDVSGYADGGYASAEGAYDDAAEVPGDPAYKARRHRPSANDTNVGTLADFAAYGGYDRSSGGGYDRGADERYVQGYDPNGHGRW
jgi:hypothetical protein